MQHAGEDTSSPSATTLLPYQHGPYNPSIASSASSSAASVWSDAASQSSDDLSISGHLHGTSPEVYRCSRQQIAPSVVVEREVPRSWTHNQISAAVSADLRRHPRRTSSSNTCPPALIRQSDRKVNFVDNLVDISATIVETIWPLSSVPCRQAAESSGKGVLPLRIFIQETLKRSRTSYYTLQVALYYLILIKPHVPSHDFTMEQPNENPSVRALQCGRRMFLSALILASKYLQDRNYSARAWSKISGLNTCEINQNEIVFLLAVNWRLHISDVVFQRWTDVVLAYTPQPASPSPAALSSSCSPSSRAAEQAAEWKNLVLRLTPELDNVDNTLLPAPRVQQRPSYQHQLLHNNQQLPTPTPTPYLTSQVDNISLNSASADSTPTPTPTATAASAPRYFTPAPTIMEPSPMTSYPTTKPAPALGLLPTPRLTPQLQLCSSGFSTPAVGSVVGMHGGKTSMAYAMGLAQTASLGYRCERWGQVSNANATSSPTAASGPRFLTITAKSTSSLTSSPESMVSDGGSSTGSTSGSTVSTVQTNEGPSRLSSISSTTSLAPIVTSFAFTPASLSTPGSSSASATGSMKLDVLARCNRHANANAKSNSKMCYNRSGDRSSTTEPTSSSSPDVSLGGGGITPTLSTSIVTRPTKPVITKPTKPTRPTLPRLGSKRSRTGSVDSLSSGGESGSSERMHEEVRTLLWDVSPMKNTKENDSPRKRVKSTCTNGSASACGSGSVGLGLRVNGNVHPSFGGQGGPGMWAGILH